MKKVIVMAIALMASTMTFAAKSEAIKAITKSKDYAEAVQLVKQHLNELADNAEKAEAYNHLFELAMNKVSNETGTITENQMATQMGTGKVKPYDTLGLANAICDAIENVIECNKYDQLPNAKGKVRPQFEKNIARVWAVRSHLVNIGQEEARKGNNAGVLKYWGMFTDSAADPTFAAMDKTPEKEYAGQVAFFADEPENEVIVDAINGMYEGLDKKAQNEFLDQHLAKFPNSFTALANKGLMAVNANNAEEGAKWLRKAAAAKPDNAVVYTYLGACLSVQAANENDIAKGKDLYRQAIEAFDKAKELDPNKQMANWGYNRYQAYYGLYGADDPKTKAAEADSK